MKERYNGVNPLLESQGWRQTFHTNLSVKIMFILNDALPPDYITVVEQRIALVPEDRTWIADIALIKRAEYPYKSSSGGTAVLERGAPHGSVASLEEEVYERCLEIRKGDLKGDHVVTVIEVLSPGNKDAGSLGRKEYK